VLAYPTFVEIDFNEALDTGNCNDEVQTIEYKSCSKRLVLNKDCLLYRSKDHFYWTGPLYPLVPKVGDIVPLTPPGCDSCGQAESIEHYLINCSQNEIAAAVKNICDQRKISFTLPTVLSQVAVLEELHRLTHRQL